MEIPITQLFEFLAKLCCALFCGAAIYINAVEHPARMSCGLDAALAQWRPAYKRGTAMQASLAVLGCAFAVIAWFAGSSMDVLVAGLLLGSVAPFTLLVILPTNKRLFALNAQEHAQEVGVLLARWNKLHAVRSALSLLALIVLLRV